ncbi:hypothetical protein Bbelb_317840 [Branchiostoma belcheri]|nr:hypothetical protein Bbelb_317840 [Branchiostoma belcheri]
MDSSSIKQQAAASLFSEAKGYGQQEDAHEFLTDYSKTAKTQRSFLDMLPRVPGHAYLKKTECVVDRQQESQYRTSGTPEILDITQQTLKEAKDTRWLSHDQACKALYKSLPTVLLSLDHEGKRNCWTPEVAEELPDHDHTCPLGKSQILWLHAFLKPFLKPVEQTCPRFLRPQIDDDDAPNNRPQHQSEQHSAVTVVTYLRPPSVPNTDESTRQNTDESTQENTDEPTQQNTDESTKENTDEPTRQNTDESK